MGAGVRHPEAGMRGSTRSIRRSSMFRRHSCWMRVLETLANDIKLMVAITENIPQHHVLKFLHENRLCRSPGHWAEYHRGHQSEGAC